MLSHLRAKRRVQRHAQRRDATASASVMPTNSALFAQASGFSNLANMNVARRTVVLPTMSGSRSGSTTPSATSTPLASLTPLLPGLSSLPTSRDRPVSESEQAAADLRSVRNELHRYKEDGVICVEGNRPVDLLRFWEDSQQIYPLLFKVALDILPVQASSVPCERIFSSSKETCTLRRNLLSAALLEVLQVLKYLYKQERLDFMSQWMSCEEDYSIEHATETAINELISAGKSEELVDLLRSMDESRQWWTFYTLFFIRSAHLAPSFASLPSKKIVGLVYFLFGRLLIYLLLFSEPHRCVRCETRLFELTRVLQLDSTRAGPRQHYYLCSSLTGMGERWMR